MALWAGGPRPDNYTPTNWEALTKYYYSRFCEEAGTLDSCSSNNEKCIQNRPWWPNVIGGKNYKCHLIAFDYIVKGVLYPKIM